MPDSLGSTSFGEYFPSFVSTLCVPDGFNFHDRTHNSNGKWMLLKAFLGKCFRLALCFQIFWCVNASSAIFEYTAPPTREGSLILILQDISDVVIMSFRTNGNDLVVEWMRRDSPWTPKCIIADADRSSLKVCN